MLIVSPNATPRKGDRVVLRTTDGQVMAKVLVRRTAKTIEFASLSPAHPNLVFPVERIDWIARHHLGQPIAPATLKPPRISLKIASMSLASRIVTALLGLALIWYFWPFGGNQEVVTPIAPPEKLSTKPAAPASQAAAPKPAVPQPAASQTAHAIEAPAPKKQLLPREKADAERLAALTTETVPKPVLKPKLYYRVVVRDAGTLETRGVVITLDGIKAYDADAQCKDGKGRAWACGARARAALTMLIRGRAVNCKVPQSGKQKALTARCSVGGTDLSVWMVTQGWAKPAPQAEPKLAAAADNARKKKIGIWR